MLPSVEGRRRPKPLQHQALDRTHGSKRTVTDATICEQAMKVLWLGAEKGALTDWLTQQWVKLTGKRVPEPIPAWLRGPVGKTTGIGRRFFDDFAQELGYHLGSGDSVRGLLRLEDLRGPEFDPAAVHASVRAFYEQTSAFEMESWSDWCGLFKP